MKNLAALAFLLALAPGLQAQGRIPEYIRPHRPPRPAPPRSVPLTMLSVATEIREGAAVTRVKAVFTNRGRGEAEADFLLPLPPGAVVHESKLMVNGKEMAAETLGAGQARNIYQAIVAKRRDPLLLEYADWGLVRARIFPVPAGGKAEALFTMTALLPEAGGVREYRFPFRALALDPQGTLAAAVEIRSAKALGAVYSPTPGAAVKLKGEQAALVDWEKRGKPSRDLQVFFSPAEKDYGVLALCHRGRAPKGTFMLTLRPRRRAADAVPIPKTVNFVVDTSGSMQGKKIEQVKEALRFFLQSLRPGDAFNLVAFSSEARTLFPAPRPVDEKSRAEALDFVDDMEAAGGTNIQAAMLEGLKMEKEKERMPILLFLTDGLPTVGETDRGRILKAVKAANQAGARIFVFGAGHDVDTFLLDRMAMDGRGDRNYVQEGESIEVKVSSLLQALSRPALSGVRVDLEGAKVKGLTPSPLPDLFYGRSLTLVGRYEGEGQVQVVLTGKVRGEKRQWSFSLTLPEKPGGQEWLEPLWAQRRIAHLLDLIKLYGRSKELVEEATRLGKRYGIVTPWTSHLVAEEAERLAAAAGLRFDRGRERDFRGRPENVWPAPRRKADDPTSPGASAGSGRKPGEAKGPTTALPPATGKGAVADSKKLRALKRLESLDEEGKGDRSGLRVRRAGGKIFLLLEEVWVDQEFKAVMKDRIRPVKAFSPDYFALLKQHPQAARWLAGGGTILVMIGGEPIMIEP